MKLESKIFLFSFISSLVLAALLFNTGSPLSEFETRNSEATLERTLIHFDISDVRHHPGSRYRWGSQIELHVIPLKRSQSVDILYLHPLNNLAALTRDLSPYIGKSLLITADKKGHVRKISSKGYQCECLIWIYRNQMAKILSYLIVIFGMTAIASLVRLCIENCLKKMNP